MQSQNESRSQPTSPSEKHKQDQTDRYARRVAATLRDARRKAGLSSRQLARRAGSSHSTILAYETGKKVPVTTTFMRLLHACGFSVDFHLSPRLRGDPSYPKGEELAAVLKLAGEFPTRHTESLQAWSWSKAAASASKRRD